MSVTTGGVFGQRVRTTKNFRRTKKKPMNDDNEWISNSKHRPSFDEMCFVRDMDHKFTVARYEPDVRLWRTDDFGIVDVTHWMYIPDLEVDE